MFKENLFKKRKLAEFGRFSFFLVEIIQFESQLTEDKNQVCSINYEQGKN